MAEAGRERQGQELSLLDLLARAQAARAAPRSYRERAEAEGLRLLRLEVEDLFCYRRGEVDLGEGITVIAGPNGSGKSSLLEAIFFALYGSRACPAMGRSLGEILREGAKEGRVRLTFRCGGWEFTSEMGLKRQGERVQSERESCRLRREDGLEWVGVEEVSAQIQGLLHMDRDDFTNAVYVRQGEIDRLIRAGEEERRGMLDRLLRLERLDSYATRAKEGAARAVNRRLAGLEGELLGLRRELAALEAEDLPRVWAKLEGEIERKEKELAGLDGELARLERERAHLQERLRRLAVTEKELHELELELEGKRRRAKAQEGELDRLRLLLDGLTSQAGEQRVKLEEEARLLAEQFRLPRDQLLGPLDRGESPELLERALADGRSGLERLRAELQFRREGLARLEAELGHLQRQGENLDSQAYELRSELAALQEGERASGQELERLASSLAEVEEAQARAHAFEVEALRAERAAQLERLREREEGLRAELVAARTSQKELERQRSERMALIQAGRCPTCGQPVSEATFAEALAKLEEEGRRLGKLIAELETEQKRLLAELAALEEEVKALDRLILQAVELRARREQLAARLEDKRQALQKLAEQRKGLEERLRRTEAELSGLEAALAAKREEQKALTMELADLSARLKEAEEHQARLERLERLAAEVLKLQAKAEEAEARKKALLENLSALREDLARLERRRAQLKAEVGEREKLEQEGARLIAALKELEGKRTKLQQEYAVLLDRRGVVAGKLERLKRLEEEQNRLAGEIEGLRKLSGEVAQLEGLYRQVKGELRKRNIAAISYYFNELFRLMDSGEAYSRALIGEGYEIAVELKDGRWLDPALMSGGERALINIALRCAIHQVLARAVGPLPLILDEPTIYLDRERVQRLQLLLEELGSQLGQVLVVSHEEGLVEGADHEYRTEKGRDNISTVRKVR
jgi:exonuclease SbcC